MTMRRMSKAVCLGFGFMGAGRFETGAAVRDGLGQASLWSGQ